MLKIYYLGHSAWAAETDGHYLLFDCQDENVKSGGALSEGLVDLKLLKDKPVYVFFSHRHHDHYSKTLHRECAEQKTGCAVLGGFNSPLNNTVTLRPREKKELNGLVIHTAASTDEGVCFHIQADGLGFFFAGDHADWGDGDAANKIYYSEIDYIAGLGLTTDAAFIPVCTYSGQRPADMTRGAVYAVKKLKPACTFPMHGNNRERLYEDFLQDLRKAGDESQVICAVKKGLLTEGKL